MRQDIVAHPEVARFHERMKAWFHLQLEVVGQGDELARLRRKDETIARQERQKREGEGSVVEVKPIFRGLARLPSLVSTM